tara:strand:- start:87423 stop:87884 length:462 start_codon:yes stop_codon:yes gene_type:complete
MKLTILNTREVKKIRQLLEQNFGSFLKEDYAYLRNQKNRVFIVNKDLAKIDLRGLRIDRIGLYFGEIKPNQFRLSKEGAALLVKESKKVNNVITLSNVEIQEYFKGDDIKKDLGEDSKLVILEYQGNIIGCASYKEKTILNFLAKIHRGTVIV